MKTAEDFWEDAKRIRYPGEENWDDYVDKHKFLNAMRQFVEQEIAEVRDNYEIVIAMLKNEKARIQTSNPVSDRQDSQAY